MSNALPPARPPVAREEPRMDELATLPVFYKLKDKGVLLAGGGAGAAWKAELLAAAGAQVHVVAEEIGTEMRALAASAHGARLVMAERGWRAADMEGKTLAIGDVETEEEAASFRDAAKVAGIPVNVVDKPEFCDFQFGSIVNRSPLVIGISTDGAAPVFGQEIRSQIETMLPSGFRLWARAAKAWRGFIEEKHWHFRQRQAFWRRFTTAALASPNNAPEDAMRLRFIDETEAEAARPAQGSIVLAGAGPGDPELLTLKALRALKSADVILYDDLVSDGVLDFARREANKICVGKRGGRPSCRQSEISAMAVDFARQGKRVIRLKGGDPMVFGRADEEITAAIEAGIPVEVISGVTAAFGAAASLQLSLTKRSVARRLQFVTAHAKDGSIPGDLDFASLADHAVTTCIYMGVATLPGFMEKLIAAGLSPQTPVIVIESATRPDERMFNGTVESIGGMIKTAAITGPCLVLVGEAMRERMPAETVRINHRAAVNADPS
jgi:uroporphyrin-III C-methyltransferase / precorrin-2 dehydrogenase / sirohydrochlorin ferrochelatase